MEYCVHARNTISNKGSSENTGRDNEKKNVPWQGHKELRTSVGARNVFASSNARSKSLSPSHSARHLEKPKYEETKRKNLVSKGGERM
jgi:hypothetical protein